MTRFFITLGVVGGLVSPVFAAPVSTVPSADLTGDNTVNSADFQCMVRLNMAMQSIVDPTQDACVTDVECNANHFCGRAFEHNACLPNCLAAASSVGDSESEPSCAEGDDDAACLGEVPRHSTDLNCDGEINNADFQILVALVLQKLGGPGTPDLDGDGVLNACDDDSDDDGDPDESDCAPLDPAIHADADELCDGVDNNCDGLIDGDDPAIVQELCELQSGVCVESVTVSCFEGAWEPCVPADYALSNAHYEETETLCDGLDNDCDGFIDGEDSDLVDQCGCGDGECADDENCQSCAEDCGCDPLAPCVAEGDSYACDSCPDGYSGDGSLGCTDIDECADAPCLNGGICTDGVASFSCACAAGFEGETCDVNIDE
ncbi:MAG: MopE-related protein, partial [Myxococcota bacterium]